MSIKMEHMIPFFLTAGKALGPGQGPMEFECPLCKGRARAWRRPGDDKVHAECTICCYNLTGVEWTNE